MAEGIPPTEQELFTCLRSSLPAWSGETRNLPTVLTQYDDRNLWRRATKPYNARLQGKTGPLALVYIESPLMISLSIHCAAQQNIPVVARSGGHSYGAFSLGGALSPNVTQNAPTAKPRRAEASLILDLRALNDMHYDASTKRVTVGSGVLLGELNEYLEERNRALPTGACPTVGVGGQALAGGFGLMSRSMGLLLDNLVSVDLVTASGKLVTASQSKNADLFWAIRGAGPSFGIAYSLTFNTHPMPQSVTYFEFTLLPRALPNTAAAISRALRFYELFEAFGGSNSAVSELGMSWHVTPEPDEDGKWGTKVEVLGQFHGSRAAYRRMEATFHFTAQEIGEDGVQYNSRQLTYLESMHNVGGSWDRLREREQININEHVNFYAQSQITKLAISQAAMSAHLQHLLAMSMAYNPASGVEWFVLAPFLGGPQSAVVRFSASQESAFFHRDLRVVWEFYAKTTELPDDGQTTDQQEAQSNQLRAIVHGMTEHIEPREAVYPAYVDPEMTEIEYPRLIWGTAYPRLQSLKAKYDGANVFRYPQSVQPGSSSAHILLWLSALVVGLGLLRMRLKQSKGLIRRRAKAID